MLSLILGKDYKDENGVDVIRMLFLELLRLSQDAIPLGAVYSIDKVLYAHEILQELPIVHGCPYVDLVGNGIA